MAASSSSLTGSSPPPPSVFDSWDGHQNFGPISKQYAERGASNRTIAGQRMATISPLPMPLRRSADASRRHRLSWSCQVWRMLP